MKFIAFLLAILVVVDATPNRQRRRHLKGKKTPSPTSSSLDMERDDGPPPTEPVPAPVAPPVIFPPVTAPTITPPVTAPVDAPVDAPVPVDTSADGPVEEIAAPVRAPVNTPVDAPVEASAGGPVDAPAHSPVDAPIDAPIKAPVDTPVEAPVNAPVGAPADVPIDAPIEEPIDPPVEAPIKTPADVPVETPADAPVDASVEAPVDAPVDPPVDAPVDAPVNAPVDTSVTAPASEPTIPIEIIQADPACVAIANGVTRVTDRNVDVPVSYSVVVDSSVSPARIGPIVDQGLVAMLTSGLIDCSERRRLQEQQLIQGVQNYQPGTIRGSCGENCHKLTTGIRIHLADDAMVTDADIQDLVLTSIRASDMSGMLTSFGILELTVVEDDDDVSDTDATSSGATEANQGNNGESSPSVGVDLTPLLAVLFIACALFLFTVAGYGAYRHYSAKKRNAKFVRGSPRKYLAATDTDIDMGNSHIEPDCHSSTSSSDSGSAKPKNLSYVQLDHAAMDAMADTEGDEEELRVVRRQQPAVAPIKLSPPPFDDAASAMTNMDSDDDTHEHDYESDDNQSYQWSQAGLSLMGDGQLPTPHTYTLTPRMDPIDSYEYADDSATANYSIMTGSLLSQSYPMTRMPSSESISTVGTNAMLNEADRIVRIMHEHRSIDDAIDEVNSSRSSNGTR